MAQTQAEIVEAVREHANKNYEFGWDVVVECWEDADIIKAIGVSKTSFGAIREVNKTIRLLNERKREVMSEVF